MAFKLDNGLESGEGSSDLTVTFRVDLTATLMVIHSLECDFAAVLGHNRETSLYKNAKPCKRNVHLLILLYKCYVTSTKTCFILQI